MASIITATTSSGLTQSADNSGVLQLASGAGNLVTIPSVTGTAMVSGNMPAFSVYNNGSLTSVTGGVWTKLVLNTEEFDTNNNFDSTTNYRFTPTVAGYYQISGTVASGWSTTAPTHSSVAIYKNGTIFKWGEIGALTADIGSVSVSSIIQFNGSTDYIELYFRSQSATGVYQGGAAYTYMSGCLVRAA